VLNNFFTLGNDQAHRFVPGGSFKFSILSDLLQSKAGCQFRLSAPLNRKEGSTYWIEQPIWMTVILPTAHTLGTQSTLVDSVNRPSSNTNNLVIFADTNIRSINGTSLVSSLGIFIDQSVPATLIRKSYERFSSTASIRNPHTIATHHTC
jgi:hypothetical protein